MRLARDLTSEIHTDSAEQFIERIRPWSTLWAPLGRTDFESALGGEWVWRGHGDARWKLCGTSLRDEESFDYIDATIKEFDRLVDFCGSSWQTGLRVPEAAYGYLNKVFAHDHVRRFDAEKLRAAAQHALQLGDAQSIFDSSAFTRFPEEELWESMALARHHGLSVRLVDWTTDPLIAAYFAAKSAAAWVATRNGRLRQGVRFYEAAPAGVERLCLWAYNLTNGNRVANRMKGDGQSDVVVQYVDVPQWGNTHQVGQGGRLTVNKAVDRALLDEHANHTVEGAVRRWAKETECEEHQTLLRKVTLPIEEAPRLLRMLGVFGVNAQRAFPTYAGVVERIEEERLLYDTSA